MLARPFIHKRLQNAVGLEFCNYLEAAVVERKLI